MCCVSALRECVASVRQCVDYTKPRFYCKTDDPWCPETAKTRTCSGDEAFEAGFVFKMANSAFRQTYGFDIFIGNLPAGTTEVRVFEVKTWLKIFELVNRRIRANTTALVIRQRHRPALEAGPWAWPHSPQAPVATVTWPWTLLMYRDSVTGPRRSDRRHRPVPVALAWDWVCSCQASRKVHVTCLYLA